MWKSTLVSPLKPFYNLFSLKLVDGKHFKRIKAGKHVIKTCPWIAFHNENYSIYEYHFVIKVNIELNASIERNIIYAFNSLVHCAEKQIKLLTAT